MVILQHPQEESTSSTTAKRLEAIELLLDRYRNYQKQEGEGGGDGDVAGYYVHPALSYVPDKYGGICGRVTQSIKRYEILFVIPQQERLSFATVGPKLQPKSLYEHYLLKILKECKERLGNDYPFVDSNNIIGALLIMYCWKNEANNSTDSGSGQSSSSSESNKSNLKLYMESWPSHADLLSSYLSKEDRRNMLRGTCSEYYLQQRTKAQDIIVSIILDVLKSDSDEKDTKSSDSSSSSSTSSLQLVSRFCDETSHEGFSKIFSLAWKIVDSRCHTGLEDEAVSSDMFPIIDLTNGLPAGSKDVNAEIVTDYWDTLKPRLPIPSVEGKSSPNKNGKKKATKKKNKVSPPRQQVVTALFATRDIQANEEIYIEYGALPPSSFLIKYGCIPEQFLLEPQLMTESIMLLYPPSMAPNTLDTARIRALQQNDFPTTMENGLRETMTTWLHPYDLTPLIEQHTSILVQPKHGSDATHEPFQEPDALKLLRQYLTVAIVGDDKMIQTFLQTSRLRGAIDPRRVGKCLLDVIDYNLSLLLQEDGNKNNNTIELQELERGSSTSMSFVARTCKIQRILYRDALAQWRHLLGRLYGIALHNDGATSDIVGPSPSADTISPPPGLELGVGCAVCGRTVPFKRCTKCKEVGYCCREHQKLDWKFHKKSCTAIARE